jgi:uncharacterized RDD family membrane protein YckC
MTDTPQLEAPSLLRRVAAIVYDTCLVLPLVMVSVAIAFAVRAAVVDMPTSEQVDTPLLKAYVVQAIEFLAVVSFFSYFWIKNGQTLAMQAWRIKLVDSNGGSGVSLKQAIIRCFAVVISIGCLGLGYLWCLFDSRGRSWHDHLSGTELILLPKKNKT